MDTLGSDIALRLRRRRLLLRLHRSLFGRSRPGPVSTRLFLTPTSSNAHATKLKRTRYGIPSILTGPTYRVEYE